MNLIFQHWVNLNNSNTLPRWAEIAMGSIRSYAEHVGSDYILVDGYPLGKERGVVAQKLFMLDEKFDEYDDVLLLDTDMVASRKHKQNAFDEPGVGRLHLKAMSGAKNSKQGRHWPGMYKQGAPIFFGNFIKLTREQRITLRNFMPSIELIKNNMGDKRASRYLNSNPPNDEQCLHWMIWQSGIFDHMSHDDLMVNHNKYCDMPEECSNDATLIHFCGSRKNNIEQYSRNI